MDRLRTSRKAIDRYPEIMARLDVLLEESTRDELGSSIDALLERIALSTSDGVDLDPERVNLLTLHATKGLEFPRVIIVGVEDHEIPGYYPTVHGREGEIEEARRLLYVGMTRAQDRLTLTRVDRRAGRDAGGSRFLEEMGLA